MARLFTQRFWSVWLARQICGTKSRQVEVHSCFTICTMIAFARLRMSLVALSFCACWPSVIATFIMYCRMPLCCCALSICHFN